MITVNALWVFFASAIIFHCNFHNEIKKVTNDDFAEKNQIGVLLDIWYIIIIKRLVPNMIKKSGISNFWNVNVLIVFGTEYCFKTKRNSLNRHLGQ